MDAGQLVADEIVLGMIRERLGEKDVRGGFILDGFPRNLSQARALEELLSQLDQPLDGWCCCRSPTMSSCAASADAGPAASAIVCSTSTPRRRRREPDVPEDRRRRTICFNGPMTTSRRSKSVCEVYDEKTKPLIKHYAALGLLHRIAGTGEPGAVTERLEAALRASAQPRPRRPPSRAAARRGSTNVGRSTRKRPLARRVGASRKTKSKKKSAVKGRRHTPRTAVRKARKQAASDPAPQRLIREPASGSAGELRHDTRELLGLHGLCQVHLKSGIVRAHRILRPRKGGEGGGG